MRRRGSTPAPAPGSLRRGTPASAPGSPPRGKPALAPGSLPQGEPGWAPAYTRHRAGPRRQAWRPARELVPRGTGNTCVERTCRTSIFLERVVAKTRRHGWIVGLLVTGDAAL